MDRAGAKDEPAAKRKLSFQNRQTGRIKSVSYEAKRKLCFLFNRLVRFLPAD